MTRSELITAMSLRFPQLSSGDVEASVMTILNGMTECLSRQARIEIRGFGVFFLSYRPPRVGRNPKTGDPLDVPGKRAPRFKGGKQLVQRVNPPVRVGAASATSWAHAGHVHVGASGAA